MDDINREMFLMHSETDEYKSAMSYVDDVITDALSQYKKPIISFSGGKDSLVMMHRILKHDKNIMVFHWDYGRYYVPRDIESATIDIIKSMNADYIVETSTLYEIEKRNPSNVFYRVFFGHTIKMMKKAEYDLSFVGLREQESLKRKRKINDKPFRQNIIDECYPLHKLTWKDIWAYIISNDLPYLKIYDKYAKLIGYDKVRFATFFDAEFDKLGASNIDGFLMPEFKHPFYTKT